MPCKQCFILDQSFLAVDQATYRRVTEAAFTALDLALTVRFTASGRMANRDPLGIDFEPASHRRCFFRLCPLPLLRQDMLRFAFHRRVLFSAWPSHA
jgi:hypothetical protein